MIRTKRLILKEYEDKDKENMNGLLTENNKASFNVMEKCGMVKIDKEEDVLY